MAYERTLYPEIEPYESGMLDVGEGHSLYYERVGTPGAKPASAARRARLLAAVGVGVPSKKAPLRRPGAVWPGPRFLHVHHGHVN